MDPVGELVAAAVVDERVWNAHGDRANDGIYLAGQPGPALPFVIFRAWKVPVGVVSEEIRLIGPSGRTIFRWGPEPRRMAGAMDLTTELDRVDDAVFDETGTFVASFMIDEAIVGEIEFPVFVQSAPEKLPKETEDGLKKSDVIWVGTVRNGKRRTIPAWFVYRNGKIYVLAQRLLEGAEWEAAAALLADKRKSRNGSPAENIAKWRGKADIVELTPNVPA
jgi:hypothetical protein